jgi:alkanesulfonate monooxygenase SsuD/methylene tetrahydromethanopterin reductase-like flavin-dependent oxidoreductase (luciferase family)
MSLKGEWAEMGELISDEMVDAFAVTGEYDEIAGRFLERYGDLLDDVNFSPSTDGPIEEVQLRRIIQQLQDGA